MAAASFPAFRVTGAIHHFVRIPGQDAPIHLGTCEQAPSVNLITASKPVMNDVTGGALPAQKVDQGEFAQITCGLNYFSQSTLNQIDALRYNTHRGRFSNFSRGRLRYGFQTFELWMLYENYLAPNAQVLYPDLPPGYYWPQVELVGKQEARLGTTDQLCVLSLEAQPKWTGQANANAVALGEREWVLYSQRIEDFPAAVRVPQ